MPARRPKRPYRHRALKDRLKLCHGQMAALLASRLDPETILVLKGNKPLELCFHKRHRAILYASDLDAVLDEEPGWRELPIPAMSLMVFSGTATC